MAFSSSKRMATTRRFFLSLIMMTSTAWSIQACASHAQTPSSQKEAYEALNLFGEVYERVKTEYVEDVPDKKIIEGAINGMLTQLDPHSAYLNADDFKDMQVQTKGEFGGLGIEVTMEDGLIKVVSPIDDTPAFHAGIQSGDFITHLNNEPVMGKTLAEAIEIMRGKAGTDIDLKIRREGKNRLLDIKLTRAIIKIKAVKSKLINGDVGYIRITTFNDNTQDSLDEAFKSFEKTAQKPLRGIIVDLRNNPGGLLVQAISVADSFLEKGEIVSTRGRNKADNRSDVATTGDLAKGLPVIVIINGGSASASEIVAGALQDHGRAIIMGTKSFGKGSVQTVIPISRDSAIKLTTARYYTPSGRSIQAKGIDPDIIVENAKIDETKDIELIHEADLPGALDKEQKKEEQKNAKPESFTPESKIGDKDDYQLSRAVDLIRGLGLYNEHKN
jgi:carboxyl-terminal processing protease